MPNAIFAKSHDFEYLFLTFKTRKKFHEEEKATFFSLYYPINNSVTCCSRVTRSIHFTLLTHQSLHNEKGRKIGIMLSDSGTPVEHLQTPSKYATCKSFKIADKSYCSNFPFREKINFFRKNLHIFSFTYAISRWIKPVLWLTVSMHVFILQNGKYLVLVSINFWIMKKEKWRHFQTNVILM